MGNVIINWRNGFGNCLFQYAFARLFAEEYNLKLSYFGTNGRGCYKNPVEYNFINNLDRVDHIGYNILDIYRISPNYGEYDKYFKLDKKKIKKMNFIVGYPGYIRGMIEDYRIYGPHARRIKSWFKPIEKINKKDLAFHIRLGDNWNSPNCSNGGVIPQEYYLSVADQVKYDNLYIITDDSKDKYHDAFKHLNPIFLTNETVQENGFEDFKYLTKENISHCIRDFNMLRSFENIAIGNSTFSWWAAFLGQNKNVFVYKPWQRGHVNLGETDFDGWKQVEATGKTIFLNG